MYTRESNTGQTVVWEPEYTDHAAQALADITGTGVSSKSEAKNNAKVDLGNKLDVSRNVLDRYEEILANNGL